MIQPDYADNIKASGMRRNKMEETLIPVWSSGAELATSWSAQPGLLPEKELNLSSLKYEIFDGFDC